MSIDNTNIDFIRFINPSEVPLGDKDTRISKVTSSKINIANVFSFNENNNQSDQQPIVDINNQEDNKVKKFPKNLFDTDNEDK